jgi:hypothetical protein
MNIPQLNSYLTKAVANLETYDMLVTDIRSKVVGKKLKNSKQFLSTLRSLSIYLTFHHTNFVDNYSSILVSLLENTPDQDTERKILRTG